MFVISTEGYKAMSGILQLNKNRKAQTASLDSRFRSKLIASALVAVSPTSYSPAPAICNGFLCGPPFVYRGAGRLHVRRVGFDLPEYGAGGRPPYIHVGRGATDGKAYKEDGLGHFQP